MKNRKAAWAALVYAGLWAGLFTLLWARFAEGQCELRTSDVRKGWTYSALEPALAVELGGDYSALAPKPVTLPYTGLVSTGPDSTEIEHIVSLGEALRWGGCDWTEEKWRAFQADLDNLTLALDATNEAKGIKDESQWLPPVNRCWYVRRRTVVVERYGLQRPPDAAAVAARVIRERDCRGL